MAKDSYCKVGLLGDNADRGVVPLGNGMGPLKPDKLNNPTLGLIHEKGSVDSKPPLPRRSFLQVPLEEQLPLRIREIGVEAWRRLVIDKGLIAALTFLGIEATNVIDKGFATGGYGKWKGNRPRTIKRKGHSTVLVDSAQLRKAVHSVVIKKGGP